MLEHIKRQYETCERSISKPHRYKLSIGLEECRFSHVAAVDTLFIADKPVLHLVDGATHFTAAFLLRDQK